MRPTLAFSKEDKAILKPVLELAKARKAKLYLVGGFLRDVLAGRRKENPDFDFCLRRGAINFGRNLAKKINAGFVVLDKEHGACRAVKKAKGKIYTLDFTDFRGPTLEKDLLHRDFTINSMALELGEVFKEIDLSDSLIDPYQGTGDIKGKLIRQVNIKSFSEDPLRILRAFSFAAIFDFEIDSQTLERISAEKEKLAKVSGERIRDELFKVFDTDATCKCFAELDRLKILKIIFPEIEPMRGIGQGPYHHLDVWQHTLETLKQLELLLHEIANNEDIRSYLNEVISSQRRRLALLKLGAFLHDVGKPGAHRRENGKTTFHGHERLGLGLTKEIALRLRLSNDEMQALHKIVLCHLRPGYLADTGKPSERAKFRFFRDANTEGVSTLLISIADQRATKGPLTTNASRLQHERVCHGMIKEYFKKKKEKKASRLVNGDDLIRKFKLEPGPLIGKILAEVEESQAIGKIKTKEEALKIAKKFIK